MHMLYPYAVLWKDKLFYSHVIMNTVLSWGGEEREKKSTYFSIFKL